MPPTQDPRNPAAASPDSSSGPAVLATDFDRTLTGPDLHPDPIALAAVDRVRAAGHPCILVTGRPARDLDAHPGLSHRFDGLVLEGGAIWGAPDRLQQAPNAARLVEAAHRLAEAGEALDLRTASFTAPVASLERIARLAPELSLHANVNQVDVLPPGNDKGTGLRHVLDLLGLQGRRVLAVGDGENDIPLFRVADKGVALANACAPLRSVAAYVTAEPGPAGFVQVADRLVDGGWA